MYNKVAIITGSSSGIGAGIALKLSSMGARVVVTGRDERRIQAVVEKCGFVSSGKVLGVRADLLVDTDVRDLVDQTIAAFGCIDILVNSAGIMRISPFDDRSYLDTFDEVMSGDLRCIQVLTHLVVPYIEATKGVIINISSLGGQRPAVEAIAYSMAKNALDMFTRCLAIDLGPKGVRVNGIAPGPIRTPIMDDNVVAMTENYCQSTFPVARIGETNDVSEMVAYLASDKSSFITGAIILVDGGAALV
ncbi:unnamed protein product [Oppiella nova]|uniref:Uncharacterized protein n=1 Tax=Oppiella nova TaxID=334625 RepID=A0A7R9M608_9ACAR|nr:unnamed protein product [Oppiella nova]CAG2170126.1 unnamed protein product [Oppiella nova]